MTVQAKADLLAMENLFYNQKFTKTFEFKGIQRRRVKNSLNSAAPIVGFYFITAGQQCALTVTPVSPISKAILREATKANCFLSKCNIINYSCDHYIACSLLPHLLIDTIVQLYGYKDSGVQGEGIFGKEGDITVVPPREYQERFVSALDSYFMRVQVRKCACGTRTALIFTYLL